MGRYDTFNVLVPKRDKKQVRQHSHYDDKIDYTPGRPAGKTRDWGDASVPVQDAVRDALVNASKAYHLSEHDTALILAIVRNESGFNPDAANKEWSPSGTGQFLDKIGPKYGVPPGARFDIVHNADGIVRHYMECKKWAEKWHHDATDTERDRWIYKYYHDGGGKGRGFEEFDKPDGVRQWISPIEGAIGPLFDSPGSVPAPPGVQPPRVNKAPAPAVPTRSEQYGVPDPPGPVSSGSPGLPQAPVAYNLFTGKPISAALPPSPGQAPFSLYGNLLTGAPPGQAATADPLLAAFSVFDTPPAPGSYPASSGNLLTSPPTIFQGPYGTGHTPVRQAQEAQAASRPGSAFYSLKDRLDFHGHVYRVAKPVSDATGISLPFILAHTAHEVDFRKKIEGNNLFNIKADEARRGPTYTKGDKAYRAYPSYEESMKDYLEYLQSNPRYSKIFEPVTRQSLGRLVDAIHYAGYSDNPLYGHRILAASKDPIMKRALWQFDKWPPKATEEG